MRGRATIITDYRLLRHFHVDRPIEFVASRTRDRRPGLASNNGVPVEACHEIGMTDKWRGGDPVKWSEEAQAALSKVPFFVRRRVRKRVEEEAARSNAREVAMEHVRACQKRFLESMEEEVKGYQVESCFGGGGCPNRIMAEDLVSALESLLQERDLRGFLKSRVSGPLKLHHEFRVTVADCPNACSRPQIVDVGIIAALRPEVSADACSFCGLCVDVCKEGAVTLPDQGGAVAIDSHLCVSCGQCVRACPNGAVVEKERGWRVLLGGNLGRHPQLGLELPGIYSTDQVLEIVHACVDHFMEHNVEGERLGDILNRTGLGFLAEKSAKQKKQKK
ncbi:MAG: 4Fe-4S binding protein [Thermodesulfobacteriota bacterium]